MHFYILDTRVRTPPFDTAYTTSMVPYSWEAEARCSECGEPSDRRVWLQPPAGAELQSWCRDHGGFVLETWGPEYGDLVSASFDLLVSERFAQCYRENDLVGLSEFEPFEFSRAIHYVPVARRQPRYLHAVAVLGTAAVESAASECEWEVAPSCPVCRTGLIKRWKRIVIEPGSWSGEDIFRLRGLNELVVSARFKEMCETHAIKNAVFVPAEHFGQDFYPFETWRGGTTAERFDICEE